MKTWTANFQAKVEKQEGEQPCFLVTIEYGLLGNTVKLTNADQDIVLGSDIYKPYLLEVSSIAKNIDIEDNIASVINGSLRIARNSTTDVLLSNTIKNHKLKIWQFFIGLTDVDKLIVGSFIINQITSITQSTIEIAFKNREAELTELPKLKFNKTDYPGTLDGNLDMPVPFVLGDITDPDLSDFSAPRDYARTYIPSVVALICSDKFNRKFIAHRLPNEGVQSQTINWVYKLEGDVYALLESDTSQAKNFSVDLTGNKLEITVNRVDAVNPGDIRVLRIMANKVGTGNDCTSYKDATDYDCTVRAILKGVNFSPIERNLVLTFGKEISLPLANADLVFKRVGISLYNEGYAETVSLRYGRLGGLEWTLGDIGVGQNELYDATNLDLDNYDLCDYYIKAYYSGNNKIGVDSLYFYLGYKDKMDIEGSFKKIKMVDALYKPPPDVGGSGPPFYSHIWKTETIGNKVFNSNSLFCSCKGPNVALQPGLISYPYDHPLYLITFILNKIYGFDLSTEIDGTNFDEAYTYLNLDGRTWHLGNQIKEVTDGLSLLANLLNQCFLKLFKGDDGKWKLYRFNRYGEETITCFRDLDKHDSATDPPMVNQMSNFIFYQNDLFFNKFVFNYHYNAGKNIFDKQLIKDQTNDTQLQSSYQEYGSVEIPYPVQDYNWHRQSPETNIFALLKKFWRSPALIMEFDTNLVASKFELGDFIRVNHKAQTWTSNLKDFQIFSIEQTGNSFHIKAIEIML